MFSDYIFLIVTIAFLTMLIGCFLLLLSEFPYFIRQWFHDNKIKRHNRKAAQQSVRPTKGGQA